MNEFKFNCPKCGQHILANAAWIGRRLNCPSCDVSIAVPAPAKAQKKNVPLATAPGDAKPKLLPGGLRIEPPAKVDETRTAPPKELKQTEPPAAAPAVAKSKPATGVPGVKPPAKSDKIAVVPAKAPNQTKPRPAAPVVAKSKLGTGETEVKPPTKSDKTVVVPAKAPNQIEPPAATPAVAKSKLATGAPGVQPPAKSDKIVVVPAKAPNQTEPPATATEVAESKSPAKTLRVELPAETAATESVPATASQPVPKVADTPVATPPEAKPQLLPTALKSPEQSRVAILSPAVKLDLTRAVRRRIADESAWLPGKVEGDLAYAAKLREGEPVLLDFKSSEATRFSLVGAFLLEMHLRQVIKTAAGRRKFLDEEIPETIREVLLEKTSDEERERAEDPLANQDLLAISHSECLAVLDVLEERYSQRVDQLRIEKSKKRVGNVRLSDLVKKLEKKARILPEDVATALYHELMDVHRRLERLESREERQDPQPR